MGRWVFLSIFGAGGLAILLGLGVWQMQRLAWKQQILEQIETRIRAPEVTLPDRPDLEGDKYLPVQLRGQFSGPDIKVLVSVKQVGAGYRLISAFVAQDGRRVLVDRGFLPSAGLAGAPVPQGAFDITGNLHWPQETDSYTPAPDRAQNLWFARDVDQMAAALNTLPVLVVLRRADPQIPGSWPIPVDTAGIPNDHLQYAITWFSLAAIWLAMTVLFWGRLRPKHQG